MQWSWLRMLFGLVWPGSRAGSSHHINPWMHKSRASTAEGDISHHFSAGPPNLSICEPLRDLRQPKL